MTRHYSKAPSQRQLKISREIHHALAQILIRGEIYMPSLSVDEINISEVRVSSDLKIATAFVILRNAENPRDIRLRALSDIAPSIRYAVAKYLSLRYLPELRFVYDDSFDKSSKVNELLRNVAHVSEEDVEDDSQEI